MDNSSPSVMDLPRKQQLNAAAEHVYNTSEIALRSFDAFPKVNSTYKQRSNRGGLATILLYIIIGILVWYQWVEYMYGDTTDTFSVDRGVGHTLQINVDMTVAMPCHCELRTCLGISLLNTQC